MKLYKLTDQDARRIKAELEARCKDSMAEFIKHCQPRQNYGWHLDLIAEHLEAVAEGRAEPVTVIVRPRVLRGGRQ